MEDAAERLLHAESDLLPLLLVFYWLGMGWYRSLEMKCPIARRAA